MAKCNSARYFFSLASLQIGDLQSYLSDLILFLAPDCNAFYVLVDNRPWLEGLVSRPAHLWQLMVTKSRMSPFAIRRTKKGRKDASEFSELKLCSETPTASENLRRWFSVIDAATLSRKRALLPVKKLRSSLLANSKLDRTLYGFIVFEVAWEHVRGINYLNELQTDTSLAIEAKYMKRWEFDSIAEAAKSITSWFPGTLYECFLLEHQLNSMLGINLPLSLKILATSYCFLFEISAGDVFHDAPNRHDVNGGENISKNICEQTEKDRMSMTDSPLSDGSNKDDFYADSESVTSECEEVDEATEYRDVLLLFRFNDRDVPFELQDIIMSDLRLLTLLEAGLPSWVIFFQSYPVFCHIYRPWMCPLARVLYVVISLVTVVIGFYDLYKNIPLLKATAARLCGPLFGWIETWEMVSRIKYLGTMLFLHNFKKAVKWFLMMTRTVRSYILVITQPLSKPFMVVLEALLPIWNTYIQIGEYFFSFIWILMATCWNLVEILMEIVLFPFYFISSIIWVIATAILYPIFWLVWGILYAPIRLILGLSNLVGFMFNQTYDFIGGMWLFLSGLFKLASNAETTVGSYEVSMWRALWNDLFSQIFRAVRSILNGFVAFFTACNRHRLSIYNHLQEFIRRFYQLITQRSHLLNSIKRAKKSGSKTLAEATERKRSLLTKSISYS